MPDKQRIWGFFSHASIIIGMMFVVFFAIDQFNPAMEFLTSSLSKWLMLVLALCAILTGLYSAVFLFQKQKRRDEKRGHSQTRPIYEREYALQERPAQPHSDPRAYPQDRQPNAAAYCGQQQSSLRQTGRSQEYSGFYGERPGSDYEQRDSFIR